MGRIPKVEPSVSPLQTDVHNLLYGVEFALWWSF